MYNSFPCGPISNYIKDILLCWGYMYVNFMVSNYKIQKGFVAERCGAQFKASPTTGYG